MPATDPTKTRSHPPTLSIPQAPQRRKSLVRRWRERLMATRSSYDLLPTLIKVFAGFIRVNNRIDESEIDSTLSFLRYDYQEAIYSELREMFRNELRESQDLEQIARDLADSLGYEDKVLLGVQLFVLISRQSELDRDQLTTFYQFMTHLGAAGEAIHLVYQLNATAPDLQVMEDNHAPPPLETLVIAATKPADLVLERLRPGQGLSAFRLNNIVLVKNTGKVVLQAGGREISPGEFSRLYEGQRILLGDLVVSHQDLIFYFNSKKQLSTTCLYLGIAQGAPFIERSISSDSHVELRFGLGVRAHVLRDTSAALRGKRLDRGVTIEANLQDKIVFDDRSEIRFSELRGFARGGAERFELNPSRSEYLVSNNPTLLRSGDILLSPGLGDEVLLKIQCDYDAKTGTLEVLSATTPVLHEGKPVIGKTLLPDGATVTITDGQYLRCHFGDRIIEEERNIISRVELREVTHSYDGRETALDGITLTAHRGEMICVIGPSGCGKSTLLKAVSGHLKPSSGQILLNGHRLYRNHERLTPYIAFIPQEDSFDPLLTIEENVDLSASIRAPHLRSGERLRRVDAKLVELGLNERRHRLAGTPKKKFLSGGERKRLNLGMDMIGIADVYLIDEPTSGLSSKDSEHVIEIIRELARNKIVFVSIHQPSSKLFHSFDRALLLDHNGKFAFLGTPKEMLRYFAEAESEALNVEENPVGEGEARLSERAVDALTPDFIFDVLESPMRDPGGNIIYEQDIHGHLQPARRFQPNFWRDRFQARRTMHELDESQPTALDDGLIALPPSPSRTFRDEQVHFLSLLKRSFLSKLRNRGNLVTTLLEAPFLALLIAGVLRYAEDGTYTFKDAFHIPTYIFLSLVVAMFLGLTNSADEILRDRAILTRERNYKVRYSHYLVSKYISLGFFALCQCFIYLVVGNVILEVRGMFFTYLFWMFLTTMTGAAAGLVISSLVNDSKTALNIIPIILIPQIILGGALIEYKEMNQNLHLLDSLRSWTHNTVAEPSELRVPFLCEAMPLRWSYEGMILAQGRKNPVARLEARLNDEVKRLGDIPRKTPAEKERFMAAKEALVLIPSLEAPYPRKLSRELRRLEKDFDRGTFLQRQEHYMESYPDPKVSAQEVYQNQEVEDLILLAESEYYDRRRKTPVNVFFGPLKHHFGLTIPTIRLNALMMILFVLVPAVVLYLILRRQLSRT